MTPVSLVSPQSWIFCIVDQMRMMTDLILYTANHNILGISRAVNRVSLLNAHIGCQELHVS